MRKILAAILVCLLLCAPALAQGAEMQFISGAFAYGCFGYEIPFLYENDQVQQTPGEHIAVAASYDVQGYRLSAPVSDLAAAQAIVGETLGDVAKDAVLREGEDGVYSAFFADGSAYAAYYCNVFVKDDTLLFFRSASAQAMHELREHVILLDESVWSEDGFPVSMPDQQIAPYLPFALGVANLDVSLENLQSAMTGMLSKGELGVYWDEPQSIDDVYNGVSCHIQALGCGMTVVYSRETSDVESIQWYSLLNGDAANYDIYEAANNAGQTGAAALTALFFAENELDMAKMGARVGELQSAFTVVQSWLSAVSNECLILTDVYENSLDILGRKISVRITADTANGHRVEYCLQGME